MGKKKSQDDDLDDLLAATAAPTGFMGWLLSIWVAILAIFGGAPAIAQIPAKKAKAKKAAPAPAPAPAAAAPAPAPAKAKKTKAKKAKKQEVQKPKEEPMPTLGGSSNWADDGDDGWATAGSKPVASKKGKKTQEADPDDGFATVSSKKDKKKGGSAPAPAPAPVEDDWAPAAKKGKSSKKEEQIEPSGPVTLNNKAKKLKKRLITFYEKHNKQKAKDFKAGKNDDLCAHFCKAGNSLEMLNEKLLDLYSQDLESIA